MKFSLEELVLQELKTLAKDLHADKQILSRLLFSLIVQWYWVLAESSVTGSEEYRAGNFW